MLLEVLDALVQAARALGRRALEQVLERAAMALLEKSLDPALRRQAEREAQLNEEIDALAKAEEIQLARVVAAESRVAQLKESQEASAATLQQRAQEASAIESQIAALESAREAKVEDIKQANARVLDLNATLENSAQEIANLVSEQNRITVEIENARTEEAAQQARIVELQGAIQHPGGHQLRSDRRRRRLRIDAQHDGGGLGDERGQSTLAEAGELLGAQPGAYEAVFDSCGVLRVETLDELASSIDVIGGVACFAFIDTSTGVDDQ